MHMLPVINPIALQLGPIPVHWYGIILGLAALAGLLLAIREGKRFHIQPEFFMDLLLYGVPSAIIGARIYYVAFQWNEYKDNFRDVFAIWQGGIAIHGALIGAIIAAVIYTRVRKVNFWRIADICAPSLIAGQMIGRWGNFVNQEAHGGPVDQSFLSDTLHLPGWIVNHMEIGGVFYHPTFLYESVWNLLGLLLLFWLRRRPFLRAGELFAAYFAWYSTGRFFIEGLRTDSLTFTGPDWLVSLMNGLWSPMEIVFTAGDLPAGGGNIRIAQLMSLLLVLAAVAFIIIRRARGGTDPLYSDPVVFGGSSEGGAEADKPNGEGGAETGQTSAESGTESHAESGTESHAESGTESHAESGADASGRSEESARAGGEERSSHNSHIFIGSSTIGSDAPRIADPFGLRSDASDSSGWIDPPSASSRGQSPEASGALTQNNKEENESIQMNPHRQTNQTNQMNQTNSTNSTNSTNQTNQMNQTNQANQANQANQTSQTNQTNQSGQNPSNESSAFNSTNPLNRWIPSHSSRSSNMSYSANMPGLDAAGRSASDGKPDLGGKSDFPGNSDLAGKSFRDRYEPGNPLL